MPKPSSLKARSLSKTILIFALEDVLIPGAIEPNLDISRVKKWLSALNAYVQKHPTIHTYLITGFTEKICHEKMNEFGLNRFFSPENILAVNESYLSKMEPIDRERYTLRCENDPYCQDEYFRQVQIQALMKEKGYDAAKIVVVGRDYWFDGFYTRRFSKVDMAFVDSALSARGKPVKERIEGLWYIDRQFASLKKIIEGRSSTPTYTPLDTWVNITMAEELFGGKGFPTLKRVVIQRKKDGSGMDFTSLTK